MPASRTFPLIALALSLTFLWVVGWYWHTASEIAGIWWRSDTFAHGLVVLPAFAWLVWRARDRIGELQPQPVGWMALAVLAAGLLWLLGGMVSVAAAQHFALFAMLVSAFVGVLGWRLSRVLLFPLAFLFFGVPIGDFMLPTLMHYTAEFTVWALRLSGVPVYQEGLHFVVPNGRWSVVEACSGVRYLIASLFVGALYAYLNYVSLKRRLLFMVVALVMPVLANWVRAYFIVMLGYHSGNKIAVGVDHILYGWVFFGVVIFLMFWIGGRWHEAPASGRVLAAAEQGASPARARWLGALPVVLAVVLFPPVFKVLDAPIEDFPVTLVAPAPASGWHATEQQSLEYRPVYFGARAETTQTYMAEGDTSVVGLHAAWYYGQRDGSEMIGWRNGPAPASREGFSLVRTARTLSVGRQVVRENLVFTPQGRVLTWHWYRINGRPVVGDAEAKLRLAADRLFGQADESAAVVLFTPVVPDEDIARARLETFLSSHLAAIEQAVEAPARSIPQ
ncbi:exosortase A [Thauera sp.]|jgi:exosortase A|uniref:exosortase A n=1 Tax=Thauera sp. TaxID=1905334 RepID=UPI002A35A37E|nr:exosortase A [Thauera sp.]MDX9885081.1 exosortase A [Thauera sp.]